jgi:hypothetical protein
VKFKDLEAYRTHMRLPHGPDEAAHLPQHIARIRAFDIITPDEPADTAEIIQLYKERCEMLREVARCCGKKWTRSVRTCSHCDDAQVLHKVNE